MTGKNISQLFIRIVKSIKLNQIDSTRKWDTGSSDWIWNCDRKGFNSKIFQEWGNYQKFYWARSFVCQWMAKRIRLSKWPVAMLMWVLNWVMILEKIRSIFSSDFLTNVVSLSLKLFRMLRQPWRSRSSKNTLKTT